MFKKVIHAVKIIDRTNLLADRGPLYPIQIRSNRKKDIKLPEDGWRHEVWLSACLYPVDVRTGVRTSLRAQFLRRDRNYMKSGASRAPKTSRRGKGAKEVKTAVCVLP